MNNMPLCQIKEFILKKRFRIILLLFFFLLGRFTQFQPMSSQKKI